MPLFISKFCFPTLLCCAGLSCAALLARYGFGVTVCESHYAPGGAAHGEISLEASGVVHLGLYNT